MSRDRDADIHDKGPGPDDIPESDSRYEDTDPLNFEKVTQDNLTGDRPVNDPNTDPDDSDS
ncbi:hypothetical protein QWJ34_05675 [Saccharibacillus sp. CPCC 101409]|uniref:hypothetical protein n=1 Tax=Saccharibacillus sp. CPCC 101409 TaxID=3058041 RepID=UPI0026716B02|nr:hypothetical protein [Saccharibacillus sp. CPCC 101409]MDO3409244.1 hypothetical protein [Saccharibacillus sp. CPCC 101409]